MAGDASKPMVALENAVNGIWQARDDCHMAAWRAAGLDGPTLDTLTRVWRHEATSEANLASKLTAQRPADVAAQLARLRRDGVVAADGVPRTTDKGAKLRQGIEDETDRLFFPPGRTDVGASAGWIREQLSAVKRFLLSLTRVVTCGTANAIHDRHVIEQHPSAATPLRTRLRVMIVEDDRDIAMLVSSILSEEGTRRTWSRTRGGVETFERVLRTL